MYFSEDLLQGILLSTNSSVKDLFCWLILSPIGVFNNFIMARWASYRSLSAAIPTQLSPSSVRRLDKLIAYASSIISMVADPSGAV